MNRFIVSFFLLLSPLFSDIFPFQTIEKANLAYKNRDFLKSARLFNSLDKQDSLVLYNMANSYYKANKYDTALKFYIKAEGVDEATRFYNIGNCYFKKNEFNQAIEFYVKSLNIKDDKDTKHNLLLAEKMAEDKQNSLDKNLTDKKKITQNIEDRDSKREKMRKEDTQKDELTYLLKQINREKIPTVMYNLNRGEREDSGKNPW